MHYIDSNIFIYPIVADEKTENKALLAKTLLIKIADKSIEAATSSLTWDEVVWCIKKILGSETAVKGGSKFLEFPNLRMLDVNEKVIYRAQKLIETYSLRPRDAIHMACCLENKIRDIISDDPDFDSVKDLNRITLEKTTSLGRSP